MAQNRCDMYAALLDAGILPPTPARPQDSSLEILTRSAHALGERYASVPVELAFSTFKIYDKDMREVISVRIEVAENTVVDAGHFHQQVTKYDPMLSASVFEHIRIASIGTFDAFTPGSAYGTYDMMHFWGDRQAWFHEVKVNAADDAGVDEDALTFGQIRTYLRNTGMMTPGQLKTKLGAHHFAAFEKKPLALAECERRFTNAPKQLRIKGATLLTALRKLYAAEATIRRSRSQLDNDVLANEEASEPHPGVVFDIGLEEHDRLVYEIVEELWQHVAQVNGFAPNCTIALGNPDKDAPRLQKVLAAYEQASDAMRQIIACCDS
jgi:hypothetical protein